MKDNLNWAVLGTGVIANEMAQTLQKMGKKLYPVGNRTHAKAVAFAEKYGIEMVYDCIDDMFLDENVDIIYITSPHNTHFQFMEKALTHGKHILVEKSITLNSTELERMAALADANHLIMAEAMTIWHMPLYKKLWEIVQSGALGKVQIMTLNFGSYKEYNMQNRFFNMNLAVPCWILACMRFPLCAALWRKRPPTSSASGSPPPPGPMNRQPFCCKTVWARWPQ